MKKNISLFLILFYITSLFNISFADDTKTDLLNQISTLEQNITDLKVNSTKDLESKALSLSNNFDTSFTNMWYDTKTIDYLVSLGKITSNFKTDLTNEVNLLNKEIWD